MTDPQPDFDARMRELKDLAGVIGILSWDQETFMPPKAGEPRAFQLSTMQGLYHQRLTEPALGTAIEALEQQKGLSVEQRAMVRNVRWERDRAVKVPGRLVKELAEEQSRSVEAWRGARARKDVSGLLELQPERGDPVRRIRAHDLMEVVR